MPTAKPLSIDELRKLAVEAEMEKARKAMEKAQARDHADRDVRDAFMSATVRPDVMQRVMAAVEIAAKEGRHEILALRFPSEFCTDGGRAINSFEPDWPKTLAGHALRAFQWYEENLKPSGYKVRAEILSFPGGMPGEVGLYLSW